MKTCYGLGVKKEFSLIRNSLFIGSHFIVALCATKSHFDSDTNQFFSDVITKQKKIHQ